MGSVLVAVGSAAVAAVVLPILPVPALASLPYLAASVAIHVAYFSLWPPPIEPATWPLPIR